MTAFMKRGLWFLAVVILIVALLLIFPRTPESIDAGRHVEPDRLFRVVETNIRGHSAFDIIVDIDHARLAEDAGSPMPPSHVILWSDPVLDAAIVNHNPVAAIDLPLRMLAYEDQASGKAAVIANSYEFLKQRHSLPDDPAVRSRYDAAIGLAADGIPSDAVATFPSDTMEDTGLVVLASPHDFSETERRVVAAIQSQGDAVIFGSVDFAERSKKQNVEIPPLRLFLFGAPGPGGKAMVDAPTLGLDAFCQKLLIREDERGLVQVLFNDLLALAERQHVSGGLPLRIINRRMKKTFTEALEN